jgi:hypothetical protein
MPDSEQPIEEEKDEGKAYLQRQAFEYQMKIARLQSVGKSLPPGGIIYYNVRTMLQMTGDELQLAIARELKIPLDCVHVRLDVSESTVTPLVDLKIPKYWVTDQGLKGNDADLKGMARLMIDGVVARQQETFSTVVARRMLVFKRLRTKDGDAQE